MPPPLAHLEWGRDGVRGTPRCWGCLSQVHSPLRPIQDATTGSLEPFVEDSIEPGSTVHTDGWQGYA